MPLGVIKYFVGLQYLIAIQNLVIQHVAVAYHVTIKACGHGILTFEF